MPGSGWPGWEHERDIMKCPRCHTVNPATSRFCSDCATELTKDGEPPASLTKTLQTPVHTLTKGTLIAGKYRIIGEIGRGGMGVVYMAEDTKLGRTVALKFLPSQWTSDSEARERFTQEARAASALDHPNICTIHEIEETVDGQLYIAMGCYEGESLKEKIKRGPLNTNEALGLATQIAAGMAKAHAKGIVHRDLKPANILLTQDGVAKVVDFGLAKLAGQVKLTREGTTVGTVAYMSPEQTRGDAIDQRTDIWSLGVVLYEMLTGRVPFKGDYEQSVIRSILKTEPEPVTRIRKDLPAGLGNIIAKALSKKPVDRYLSMDELSEDLKAIAEGLKPLRAKPSLLSGRVLGLKKIYAYTGLLGLTVLAILALLFLSPKRNQIRSIAVLPLANLSGDPGQDYFSDGMTEELTATLSQISALKVISRTSAMHFKGSNKPLREIAAALGVEGVIEGSVLRSGARVRITAQLINAASDTHLWAQTYDRDLKDVLALQSDVARAIAGEVQAKLTPQEQSRLGAAHSVNPEAHDLVLKGRLILNQMNEKEIPKALDYFQQAIALDPTYALAHAKLAQYYYQSAFNGWLPPSEMIPKAKATLRQALDLDDTLAEAHSVLGSLMWTFDRDWAGAEREMQRAIALNPNSADVHDQYAFYLIVTGRFDAGIAEQRLAMALDPLTPARTWELGFFLCYSRRYDESIAQFRQALDADPNGLGPWARSGLSVVYAKKHMDKEAIAECDRAVKTAPEDQFVLSVCGWALGFMGRRQQAQALLDRLKSLSARHYVDPYNIAFVYDGLGDNNSAMKCLERSYAERSPQSGFLGVDIWTDRLRTDPRFQELVRRMNYPASTGQQAGRSE